MRLITRISVAAAMLAATTCPAASARQPQYHNPTGQEFPIMAWYSILPDSAQTPARYRELRDAGFNISFSHFNTDTDVERALRAMKGTGVKLMMTCYPLVDNTEATVVKFRNEPDVIGYFLRDEPNCGQFAGLRAFRDKVYSADTTRLVYLNLLPSLVPPKDLGAPDYDEYVERFIDEVSLPMVSYDLYPVVEVNDSVFVRDGFYDNLGRVSRVTRRRGLPFWGFCLATAHDPYPVPTAPHLRIEAFSALAYGAQGLQYFTYWQPKSGTWNFHNAPIDETGRRTNVYYLISDLNREIQALAPVFLGAEVISVGLTPPYDSEAAGRFTEFPAEIPAVTTDGNGLLISHLRNGNRNYLMIVSRDIDRSQTVTVTKAESVRRVLPDGTETSATGATEVVAPGGYLLYTWYPLLSPRLPGGGIGRCKRLGLFIGFETVDYLV